MSHPNRADSRRGWSLVVLAAGVGSRYGGVKQLEAVGPAGETLADYALWDASRAGAERALFVTRLDLVDQLRVHHSRWRDGPSVEYVLQRLEDVPAGFEPPSGRTRPWGTVHAVLTARQRVDQPFAVLNADDFYGRPALGIVGEFLTALADGGARIGVVGYRLRDTLSRHGGVSRAVLDTTEDGRVRRISELREVRETAHGITGRRTGENVQLRGDELVSMNLWALTPAVLDLLAGVFARFLRDHGRSLTAECALPDAVDELLRSGLVSDARLLPAAGEWIGLTHPADRDLVVQAIRDRVARGEYPADLFHAARG